MTIVSAMAIVKDDRIYVRVSSGIKVDFELVAAFRGLTPSALLHSFIVKTIHEARQESPQIFERDGDEESENKAPESEKLDRVMTLDEAKADDKKKKGKKK